MVIVLLFSVSLNFYLLADLSDTEWELGLQLKNNQVYKERVNALEYSSRHGRNINMGR